MKEHHQTKNEEHKQKDNKVTNGQKPSTGEFTRRDFLKTAGSTIIGLIGLSACSPDEEAGLPATGAGENHLPNQAQYPEVPGPDSGPPPGVIGFFTPHEARTVEALAATILPGTPEDPGAREAGVVYYIDSVLFLENGFAQRTYYKPPFAMAYEGDSPPANQQIEGMNVIWVPKDQLDRYGWQSIITPREMYRMGIMAIDNHTQQQYGKNFADLEESQQEEVVGAMADDQITPFGNTSSKDFFEALRNHTIEGMFCDPAYRGNRDMVGWKLVGFPGAQRAYTPRDMHTENYVRAPQSLNDLHAMNPGIPSHPDAILPVTGSGTPGPESEGTGNIDRP